MISGYQKFYRVLLHVSLWAFVFLYPFFFDYVSFRDSNALIRTFLLTLLQLVLFYVNSLYLIPGFLAKRRVMIYLVVVLFSIAIVTFLSLLVHSFLNDDYHKNNWIFYHFLYNSVLLSMLVWGLSSGMRITTEWFRNERLKRELENQKISAELMLLKSQLNPHFLFNSLNSIYALSNKGDAARSAEATIRLSDMMRYMLYDSADTFVPLEKEISYLNDFIQLQRIRLREEIAIDFDVHGKITGKRIAPLLLIPFIENSFKHGISYAERSFIRITLEIKDHVLSFCCENSLFPDRSQKERTSGIGLGNVKRRLELIYPGNHLLVFEPDKSVYVVRLQIQLKHD